MLDSVLQADLVVLSQLSHVLSGYIDMLNPSIKPRILYQCDRALIVAVDNYRLIGVSALSHLVDDSLDLHGRLACMCEGVIFYLRC